MDKIKKVRTKGFRNVGTFFFGLFMGLLLTLAILFGAGYWAYKNLSLNKIEKITKKDINIGNESVKNLTIEDIVKNISGVVKNFDTYTIQQIEDDFDIVLIGEGGFVKDTMYGLDFTSLKNSSKSTLSNDINKIINNATINTIINYLEKTDEQLGMFATIINTDVDFYFNSTDSKLYTSSYYTTLVDFDYTIDTSDGTKIKVGSNSTLFTVSGGKISVPFRNVPIGQAFSDFDAVTDNLKVAKVLGYYEQTGRYYTDSACTDEVTGFMSTLAGKNVNELTSDFINNTKIYEVMGYYLNTADNCYYENFDGTNYTNKLTGFMATVAGKKVNELNSSFINSTQLYELLDYTRTGEGTEDSPYIYTNSSHEVVNGVLGSIAGKTVNELTNDETFNNLYIYEVMNYTRTGEGTTASPYVYKDSDLITITGIMKAIAGSKISTLKTDIQNMKIIEALNVTTPTGVLKALENSTINSLETDINDLKVHSVLGYYKNPENNKYYTDSTFTPANEVSGVMSVLADCYITGSTNSISSRIETLTLGEALGIPQADATGIVKALYTTQVDQLNDQISTLQIYEVLGYTRTGTGTNLDPYIYHDAAHNTVTGIMATLASSTVNNIEASINNLKAKDVFDKTTTPILKLFSDLELETLTIFNMPNEVVTKLNSSTTTIGDLIDAGIIVPTGTVSDSVRGMTVDELIEAASSIT